MTARIEKSVFISYRRTNFPWALAIYQELTHKGYDVFLDYLSIDSGNFEKVILENIKARAHFLVILTLSSLERCQEPEDWLRREIETAIGEKRNIVPVMLENFDFGNPLVRQALTGKLSSLNKFNGLRVYTEYFFEAMDRLRNRYLNIELNTVLYPISIETKKVTKKQQAALSKVKQVRKEELNVQEWYERGYEYHGTGNYKEAIRCYSESIALRPDADWVHYIRGELLREKGDYNGAIIDFNEVIRLEPDNAEAYLRRGSSYQDLGVLDRAITDYQEVIRLKPYDATAHYQLGAVHQANGELDKAIEYFTNTILITPNHVMARMSLFGLLQKLERESEAREHEKIAHLLIQKEDEYNRACFEAICGNTDKALELLRVGLKKGQSSQEWTRRDPDFENLREDPGFKELVGE
jgi:tetratricopeptide (TPR) repeat protein